MDRATRATTLLAPSVRAPADASLAGQLAALREVASRLDAARAAGVSTTWLGRERARHEAAIRAKEHHRTGRAGAWPRPVSTSDALVDAVGDDLLLELVDVERDPVRDLSVHGGLPLSGTRSARCATRWGMIEYARFQLRRVGRGASVDLAESGRRLEQAVLGELVAGGGDAARLSSCRRAGCTAARGGWRRRC